MQVSASVISICLQYYYVLSSFCHQVCNMTAIAGFNSTLREGNVTHHEYIQVGKGRDVGLNQISLFEAKIANGNGEQTLSRDIYRLGHRFDFFRMLSCYFTTVGFYFSTLVLQNMKLVSLSSLKFDAVYMCFFDQIISANWACNSYFFFLITDYRTHCICVPIWPPLSGS